MNKAMKQGLVPALLLLGSGLAHSITPGVYLGGGAGLGGWQTPSNFNTDKNSHFAGRGFVGYNFNQFFGLEADYTALGKTKYYYNYVPLTSADYSLNAISIVGKLYLPLSDNSPLNVYGLLGAAQMRGTLDRKFSSWAVGSIKDTAFVPTAGLGASYDLSQRFTAGLEFSGFGSKKSELGGLGIPTSGIGTLSLSYRF